MRKWVTQYYRIISAELINKVECEYFESKNGIFTWFKKGKTIITVIYIAEKKRYDLLVERRIKCLTYHNVKVSHIKETLRQLIYKD